MCYFFEPDPEVSLEEVLQFIELGTIDHIPEVFISKFSLAVFVPQELA